MSSNTTVQGGMSANLQFNATPTTGYQQGSPVTLNPFRLLAQFRPGTQADQCDLIVPMILSLAAGTPQTIDLTSLVDPLGNPVNFARLRLMAVKVLGGVDGQVLAVGNSATSEFDGFVSAGGKLSVYASSSINDGFAVFTAPTLTGAPVGPTAKTIKFDPGAAAMQVAVMLAGCSS